MPLDLAPPHPDQGIVDAQEKRRADSLWYRFFIVLAASLNSLSRSLTLAQADIDTDTAAIAALQAGKENANAHILKDNVSVALSVGYPNTPYSAGTFTSGTFTPSVANGRMQYATNNGAHTLAPPAVGEEVIVEYTNGASAGAITTSGFTKVTGSGDTTSGHKFLYRATRHQTYSQLLIEALQ